MPILQKFLISCLIAFCASCAVQSAPVPIDSPSRYELEYVGGDARISLHEETFAGDLMLFADHRHSDFRALSLGVENGLGRASMTQLKIDSEGFTGDQTVICTGTMQSWGQPFYDTDQRAEVTSREVYALGPDVVGVSFAAESADGSAEGTAYFEIVGYR